MGGDSGTPRLSPVLLTNLQRKARAYCDAVDAMLEMGADLDDAQVRSVLAILQSAETTTRELIDKMRQLCIDSGWLERISETKRTDKMRRLPTSDGAACAACGTTRGPIFSNGGDSLCRPCMGVVPTGAAR